MRVSEKVYWCVWIPLFLIICSILLVGCSDPHKNMHCVQTQRELWYIQHTKIVSGIYISQPVYHTVCTEWVHN